ncbi:hypothetical protein CIHG_00668 [Coccidioides immitis H538.4]|uniref:Uncharacterized protein n=3 Tax=Coccidioides immitis TaxID=5501 RepID=A0A0J8QNA2_COCIT|nr:hypothetical protein CIRG_03087 [Coccidioides immitis RMSCC 2394]KMU73936.1 hypothetical protein CISG_03914 [Coccidioides immitis RMSCC 3703]KMU82885.1 hypothetical protein CIHG_00668 [Coccidioides immitis H538.4]
MVEQDDSPGTWRLSIPPWDKRLRRHARQRLSKLEACRKGGKKIRGHNAHKAVKINPRSSIGAWFAQRFSPRWIFQVHFPQKHAESDELFGYSFDSRIGMQPFGPQKDADGGSIESSTIDNQCMHGNVSGPWLGSFLPLPEIDIITKFAQ